LPVNNPNTAFLEGKVLKTKKMRGTLSQGLLAPLHWVTDYIPVDDLERSSKFYNLDPTSLNENDDVTEILQVKKWVPKEEMSLYTNDGTKGAFPILVRKTDEERVQNCSRKLSELRGVNVVVTQKYDGTSTTYMCFENNFTVCGRNNALLVETTGDFHYFEIAKRYSLKENMLKLGKNLAIQGEIIGQKKDGKFKVNGNRHKVSDFEFYVFNIFDIDRQYYLNWDEILEIVNPLGLKTVPVIYRGIMQDKWLSVESLIELATEQRYDTEEICEGIVVKTDLPYGYPRTSFKVISNEYLLKYKL
jgi:RNA ligase (TIGR02306 family)